ncbi:hypothetical protein BDY24DRAFT_388701 [Mrakia frigida]|uniref:uncharacterized protein n=1 Tax=Mrakia frigida TaxID=29902 RepID=UPI003FCC16EE
MAHLDTLSSYVSTLVPSQIQEKITPSDLAWALEVPSLNDLCCWLARVVEEDQRKGRTTALEKEEREIWDRALSLGVVELASPFSSSSTLPPPNYHPPSELTEMATLNRSIASVKERRVRQLELNIDRLQRKLHDQQLNNQVRLQTEAALASEIATLDSDLTSFGLLISSTTLPTLLDLLTTSLTPHLHPSAPSSSQPLHLTQSPALFRSVASSSQDLASRISSAVNAATPESREAERKKLEVEERRLEDVFAKEAGDKEFWEEEMEKFLNNEVEEEDLNEGSAVHELMDAGREKDRLEEVERELGLLRLAKSHLSTTLLPAALLLHASLSNDIGKLRELEALLVALSGEIKDLQDGEFEGIGGEEESEEIEQKRKNWEDALRLIISSSIDSTSPDAAILTQDDFLCSLSNLPASVSWSTTTVSEHLLSLARHASRTEGFTHLLPLLSHLTQNTPTPLHPLLARSSTVTKAEVELNATWHEAREAGKEWRFLGEEVKESEMGPIERLVKENPVAAGGERGGGSVKRVGRS